MRHVRLLALIALLLGVGWAWGAEKPKAPDLQHRWLFVWRELHRPGQVDELLADMPRAAKAGYNGLVLEWSVPRERREEVKAAAARYHLDLIPKIMHGIWDPNLFEGLPVKDAAFVVHGDTATFTPGLPVGIPDGGFEQGDGNAFSGWDVQTGAGTYTFRDQAVRHGGKSALRLQPGPEEAPRDGLFVGKKIKVLPFHEYRVFVWIKTSEAKGEEIGFNIRGRNRPVQGEYKEHPGDLFTNIRGEGPNSSALCFSPADLEKTQDWQLRAVIFNSLDNTEVTVRFGAWKLKSGRVWFDDARIEEVGLFNALDRPGAPVTVRGEDGTIYEQTKDYEPIKDSRGYIWQPTEGESPVILLTKGSRIHDGQRLLVSYYHPVIIHYGCSPCLSEPAVYEAYRREVKRLNDELHPKAFFMQHDEIRTANWCALCQSKHLTPGQLLAEHMRQCVAIVKEVRPDAKIWVWSDMFDPYHNAHEEYYLVNGSWAGSWEGLPQEVGLVNWAGHLGREDLYFLASRGHEQILSCNVDDPGDTRAEKSRARLNAAEGLPGIVGAMYTTWNSNFRHIETWAAGMWGPSPGK